MLSPAGSSTTGPSTPLDTGAAAAAAAANDASQRAADAAAAAARAAACGDITAAAAAAAAAAEAAAAACQASQKAAALADRAAAKQAKCQEPMKFPEPEPISFGPPRAWRESQGWDTEDCAHPWSEYPAAEGDNSWLYYINMQGKELEAQLRAAAPDTYED